MGFDPTLLYGIERSLGRPSGIVGEGQRIFVEQTCRCVSCTRDKVPDLQGIISHEDAGVACMGGRHTSLSRRLWFIGGNIKLDKDKLVQVKAPRLRGHPLRGVGMRDYLCPHASFDDLLPECMTMWVWHDKRISHTPHEKQKPGFFYLNAAEVPDMERCAIVSTMAQRVGRFEKKPFHGDQVFWHYLVYPFCPVREVIFTSVSAAPTQPCLVPHPDWPAFPWV